MKCCTEGPGPSWLQGLQGRVHSGLLPRPAGPNGRSSCRPLRLRWTGASWANVDYAKVTVSLVAPLLIHFCPSLARVQGP